MCNFVVLSRGRVGARVRKLNWCNYFGRVGRPVNGLGLDQVRVASWGGPLYRTLALCMCGRCKCVALLLVLCALYVLSFARTMGTLFMIWLLHAFEVS